MTKHIYYLKALNPNLVYLLILSFKNLANRQWEEFMKARKQKEKTDLFFEKQKICDFKVLAVSKTKYGLHFIDKKLPILKNVLQKCLFLWLI